MSSHQGSSKQEKLEQLYKRLESDYTKLPLAKSVRDIIPGEGSADAEILFIGEAPGYHETVLRRPFVGKSGQLFRKVLSEESQIPEAFVYISNIVKARPPENRDPLPEEITAYKPYLDAEIDILEPTVIVTLGRFSMAKFLPNAKISQVHGKLHRVVFSGRVLYVLPMYHPAAALRSTATKVAFINDFKKISKIVAWVQEKQRDSEIENAVIEHLF